MPVFDGVTDYTRRGDFQVNANGNLVNGAGYYLMGVDVDPKTGNPTGNVPQVLQFQNNFIPAQATTSITYAANLPTQPKTPSSTASAAGTINAAGGINASDFTAGANPLAVGTLSPFTNATFIGAQKVNDNTGSAAPISANTLLVGTAGPSSDDLGTAIASGATLVVDGTTITFSNTQTNVTGVGTSSVTIGIQAGSTLKVGDVLSVIDGITHATVASNVSNGKLQPRPARPKTSLSPVAAAPVAR